MKKLIILFGITPAYTGNTRDQVGYYTVAGDHPRIHGEH